MAHPASELPPGDSREQREAEALMLVALGSTIGAELVPRRIARPSGGHVEVDGVLDDPPILCEAWAHQGRPKGGQRMKPLTDPFKLIFVERLGLLAGTPPADPAAERAGFREIYLELRREVTSRCEPTTWDAFVARSPNPRAPTNGEVIESGLTASERARLEVHLRPLVEAGYRTRRLAIVHLWARKPA